jgi:polyhydroxybutyrate depolymerase
MKRMAIMIFFMAALVATALSDTLEVGGVGRTYLIDGAGPKPKPLVLALHGGGGSGRQFRRSSGLLEAALSSGFVIVFPDGASRNWNDGRNAPASSTADDDRFLTALIAELVRTKVADPKNLFVTGISNGGLMAFRLVCKHPKLFQGAAPVSANLPSPAKCDGAGYTQIYNIVGTADELMPFKGGYVAGRPRRGSVLSAEETLKIFLKKNGCKERNESEALDRDPADGTTVTYVSGNDCRVAVQQVRINGGGHAWPGSRRSTTRELHAGRDVIEYFASFFN